MGNSSTTTHRKSKQSLKKSQIHGSDKGPRPDIYVTVSDASSSQKTRSREVKSPGAFGGSIRNQTDKYPSDSISNTPKNIRENTVVVLMTSSPQIRRSLAQRSSVNLSGRCKDIDSRADDETSAVTLEPLEHEWMMCASDGQWESLYRLLASDPTLINRKDFVTGFTCLHWAAKVGKHELIVMLVNFAKEHQVAINVNARSSAGYTPLHLAAMHNRIEVVKLLIGAFDADVEARDFNGKKACQYLKSDNALNILDIVGACGVDSDAENADTEDASRWRLSRIIQANFRPLKPPNHSEEDARESGALTKQKPLRRKSSFTKMKPSLHRIRTRTQIVHSTSIVDRFDKEEISNPLRPKSNLFG